MKTREERKIELDSIVSDVMNSPVSNTEDIPKNILDAISKLDGAGLRFADKLLHVVDKDKLQYKFTKNKNMPFVVLFDDGYNPVPLFKIGNVVISAKCSFIAHDENRKPKQ
jgi:hypothetical protein